MNIVSQLLIRLVPMKLKNQIRAYVARVISPKHADLEMLFQEMETYHSSLTLADYRAAFEVLVYVVCKLLSQGFFIDTPLFKFSLGVGGTWGPESSDHLVRIIARPGEAAIQAVHNMGWRRGDLASDSIPVPMHIVDLTTHVANETLTPGGQVRLQGEQSRFSLQDTQQGVFLVNHTTTERLNVREFEGSSRYLLDLPAVFPAGSCHIEVRALNEAGELQVGLLPWDLVYATPAYPTRHREDMPTE